MDKPRFTEGDVVQFEISYRDNVITCKGAIELVDEYGNWQQNSEPSYDVSVPDFNNAGKTCVVKHLRESALRLVEEKRDAED